MSPASSQLRMQAVTTHSDLSTQLGIVSETQARPVVATAQPTPLQAQ